MLGTFWLGESKFRIVYSDAALPYLQDAVDFATLAKEDKKLIRQLSEFLQTAKEITATPDDDDDDDEVKEFGNRSLKRLERPNQITKQQQTKNNSSAITMVAMANETAHSGNIDEIDVAMATIYGHSRESIEEN